MPPKRKKPRVVAESDEDEPVRHESDDSPPRRPTKRKARPSNRVVSDDDEEDPVPLSAVNRARISNDDGRNADFEEESEEEPIASHRKRARRRQPSSSSVEEDEPKDDLPVSVEKVRRSSKEPADVDEEADDDIAIDGTEPYQTQITDTRLRNRERRSALDKFKRARARRAAAGSSSSLGRDESEDEIEDADEEEDGETDESGDVDGDDDGSVVDEDYVTSPYTRRYTADGGVDLEDDLDDFIEDDGDLVVLPPEFAALDVSVAVRRVVEFYARLVLQGQKHARRLLKSEDQYYTSAFRKLQNRADSVASSVAQSSVWQKVVRSALETLHHVTFKLYRATKRWIERREGEDDGDGSESGDEQLVDRAGNIARKVDEVLEDMEESGFFAQAEFLYDGTIEGAEGKYAVD
ncbi:hypothetical protein HDU93_000108 [Gonapodya sp. JEL0774]|nr:hypothetical protein HDU93_000108 [Gonapodya sp. JEL0774]